MEPLLDQANGPDSLDQRLEPTTVTTYHNERTGKTITYVAATHFGSRHYFDNILGILQSSDRVLYEKAVNDDGTKGNDFMRHYADIMAEIVTQDHTLNPGKYVGTTVEDRELYLQADSQLPYDSPPENWLQADISNERSEEIFEQHTEGVSLEGLEPEEKINVGFDTFNQLMRALNEERECVIYSLLDEALADPTVESVAIYYGKHHQAAVEQELSDKGFSPVGSEQLEVVRPVVLDTLKENYGLIESYVEEKLGITKLIETTNSNCP